jgi:hypothetical protein
MPLLTGLKNVLGYVSTKMPPLNEADGWVINGMRICSTAISAQITVAL